MGGLVLLALVATAPPPASAEEPEERPPGWIGIVFQPRDEGAFVKLVLPGMPAEAGGVQRADMLIQANGATLSGLDIPGVRDAIAGSPGTTLTLTVRRGQRELELQVDRIDRPDEGTVGALRDEAELLAAPPDQRANKRLARLPEGHGVADVEAVWSNYLTERGEAAVREPVVMGVLGKLQKLEEADALALALEQVLPASDLDLGHEPRYQRRVADFLLAQDPPLAERARERAESGLGHAPASHREHPWLQRSLGEAALRTGDLETALAASEAALDTWPAPTLIWVDEEGAEVRRRVVDGHSGLARSRAEVLAAAGDTEGAITALATRLSFRHDEGTAEDLSSLGGTPPPPPRPTFRIAAEAFPDFALPRLIGEGEVALTDLRGRPVLLALWASWCGPCKSELSHLAEVYPGLEEHGVEVVAVNVMEDRKAGLGYAEAAGWRFPVVHDPGKTLTKALGLQSIPRSYVLDAEGSVARMAQGYSDAGAREMEALLIDLAAGGTASPHLLSLEIGDGQLELAEAHRLPNARWLTHRPGDGDPLVVATSTGDLVPLGAAGLDLDAERHSVFLPQEIHVLPDDTWVAVSKKHLMFLPAEGEPVPVALEARVTASAAVADTLVVATSGKKPLTAFDSQGAERWTGGDEAVTRDLVTVVHEGLPAAARVRPDGIEIVTAGGERSALLPLPSGAQRMGAGGGIRVLGDSLRSLSTGDLDGDGSPETVVLLRTHQVLGLSASGALLFRLQLPTDGDLAIADLDGDGRAELWIALPAAGVAALGYRPQASAVRSGASP